MAKNQQLVLAIFPSEDKADAAVASLKSWDKANDDIKLGAIGVLTKDEKGKIKKHKLGKRDGKKGAGVGLLLGIVAAVLPGVTLLGGVVFGSALGGVVGAFVHKGLGMSSEELKALGEKLNGGSAAVGVLADDHEVQAVKDELAKLGGAVEVHEIDSEVVNEAAKVEEHAKTIEADVEQKAADVATSVETGAKSVVAEVEKVETEAKKVATELEQKAANAAKQ
jgi:uncharacterized membrane protein